MYILTPAGIKSKMQLSRAFLKRKLDEYEMLKMEIEELKREVGPDQSLSDCNKGALVKLGDIDKFITQIESSLTK